MILPSDDDSRKPGDGQTPGGGEEPSGGPMPWDSGPFFTDDDEEDFEDSSGKIQSPAPPGWREELKLSLLEAIDDLREIEDPDEDFDPPEPPDLFAFYGELVALRHEMRRGSRRAVDSLQKLADTKAAGEDARPLALALLALFDQAANHLEHRAAVESAMISAGIQRIEIEAGKPFDATLMVAAGKGKKSSVIAEELEAGFLWRGRVLRPARVTLA